MLGGAPSPACSSGAQNMCFSVMQSRLFFPTAPGAPVATTWTLLTPSGTMKVSSEPVGLKVHVVVPPAVVEQLPAAWAGLAP